MSMYHIEVPGEYIYTIARDEKGDCLCVSTVLVPGGKSIGHAYQTKVFEILPDGKPDWSYTVTQDYSRDWEAAKETHQAHVKWVEGGRK